METVTRTMVSEDEGLMKSHNWWLSKKFPADIVWFHHLENPI